MHVSRFLSQWLLRHRLISHCARAASLVKSVEPLLRGGKLSLTHLGRHRPGAARVKHQIKAVDRLLGNRHLHSERIGIYKALAQTLLSGLRRPVLIVDWSDFELRREWLMLKAAVPIGGRALTVFEQAYPFSQYNSPRAHRAFLQALHDVLPANCRPIIITDAGFRGPWFREVASHGWDWLGRIRNRIKYFNATTGRWCYTDSLYKHATPTTRHLGEVNLSERRRYTTRLYLVRSTQLPRPVRKHPRRTKRQNNDSQYRRLYRAPWLLATSLPHHKHSCRLIKRLYSQRMQIEESFRDIKNHRWGFGLRYARCWSGKRLEVLLLISTLAMLALWLVGLHARQTGLARHFQANTERRRPVLSTVFLGQQLLLRQDTLPVLQHLRHLLRHLKRLISNAALCPLFVGIP